MSSSTIN